MSYDDNDEAGDGAPARSNDEVLNASSEDWGHRLLKGLVAKLLAVLEDPKTKITPAEGELIRKLCADNSVSLQSVKRGDFGKVAQRVAEEFPFPAGPEVAPSQPSVQ